MFRRYARYVGAIGLRLLGRPDEVDDLVQDVFLSAQRGLSSLRDRGAIKAWLITVTVRTARQRLRQRRARRMLGLDEVPDYDRIVDSRTSPEQRAQVEQLYRLLDGLPASQRVAWILRHVEEEDLPTVALLCECSVSTAKRRVAAANERLYKALSP